LLNPAAFALPVLVIAHPAFAQTQQLKPAPIDQIVSAVDACMAATSVAGVDGTVLEGQGWAMGSVTADGKPVQTELAFYGRADSNVVIVSTPESPFPACTAMARVRRAAEVEAVADGISATTGSQPASRETDQSFWLKRPLVIHLATTGTREKPAVRVGVVATKEKK
jgi:hypothetical protein